MVRMFSLILGLLGAASLALGACGGRPHLATGDESAEAAAQENATVVVEVVSHAFRDATVYLTLGGSRQRLGLAGGNTTSTFRVKWNAHLANTTDASLLAEQIGDDAQVQSSELQLHAGARVVWTISGQFYETGLAVY